MDYLCFCRKQMVESERQEVGENMALCIWSSETGGVWSIPLQVLWMAFGWDLKEIGRKRLIFQLGPMHKLYGCPQMEAAN